MQFTLIVFGMQKNSKTNRLASTKHQLTWNIEVDWLTDKKDTLHIKHVMRTCSNVSLLRELLRVKGLPACSFIGSRILNGDAEQLAKLNHKQD